MVDVAVAALREVDVVALIIDAAEAEGAGDRYLWDLVKDVPVPLVVVLNKIDQVDKPALLPRMAAIGARRPGAEIVPVSAATGENVAELEDVLPAAPAGRAGPLSRRLPDRPARAVLRRRAGPRAGAAPHPRRAAVQHRGRRRCLRGAGGRRRTAPAALHDPGRAGLPEADPARQGRDDDQGDRHRGAGRAGAVLRGQGLPRPARQGQGRLARRPAHAVGAGAPRGPRRRRARAAAADFACRHRKFACYAVSFLPAPAGREAPAGRVQRFGAVVHP